MKELTRTEEQIMQILWIIKKGSIKDITEKFNNPKPAYTTVSTIIRILENKGFMGHKAYGKTYEYFPLIERNDYTKAYMGSFVKNNFSNSYKKMVSFFAKDEEVSVKEMEEMMSILQKEMDKKRKT